MFEKVNPSHPDKIADRIAGALVDLAYSYNNNPRIAVEVLIGHGRCHIIAETSVHLGNEEVTKAVNRIAGDVDIDYMEVPQDTNLSKNQIGKIRCGDNGIFKGVPVTDEQKWLSSYVKRTYERYPYDGKFIVNDNILFACQSNINSNKDPLYTGPHIREVKLNPIGDWTGGIDVDSGATNRKLGSDMADSVTGGGLHGKDLSKADVSVNIYAFLKAQILNRPVELCCAIGDETVDGIPYSVIVEIARAYINNIGGFEKFAEWGLV